MTKKKDKEKSSRPKRHDRRLAPQSSHNPWLVRIAGALGSASAGAGVWAYSYAHSFESDEKLRQVPAYLIAGGAVLLGVAIWLGTSSDPPVRVGAPGIGVERGDVRRMPWSGVRKIAWDSGSLALAIEGTDESGTDWSFKVALHANPEAVAWILKEADERIPKKVDVPDEARERIPVASPLAGTRINLEPLQVVGRRCAASDQTISYEPDARICTRCERVYFKRAVPKKCKCGANLAHLRTGAADAADEETDDETETEGEEASARASESAETSG